MIDFHINGFNFACYTKLHGKNLRKNEIRKEYLSLRKRERHLNLFY